MIDTHNPETKEVYNYPQGLKQGFTIVREKYLLLNKHLRIGNSSYPAPADGKRWPRSGQVPPYTNLRTAITLWSMITFVWDFERSAQRHKRR